MNLPTRIAAALLLILLPACGNNSSPPTSPAKPSAPTTPAVGSTGGRTQIALIPPSHPAAHWKAIHAGAAKAISEVKKGPDGKPVIDLLWQPPENPDQPDAQLHTAQTLMKNGIAAIIITPDSGETLTAITTAAATSRIPIIALDTDLDTSACKSSLNPDNEKIGQLAAQHLSTAKGGRIIVWATLKNPAAAREKAFRAAIASSSVSVVPEEQTPDAVLFLSKSSTTIGAIFATDEASTAAALEVLHQASLTDKIKLVGVGNSQTLITALKEKKLSALILTDPLTTGYLAVKTAGDCIREKKVEKNITIPPHIATAENMESPEIAALLNPPIGQ